MSLYLTRMPLLAGANPFVTLYEDDQPTAYASVWRVDWSTHGSGNVVILWTPGQLRIVGDDVRLAEWIEEQFVRNFPEARALPSWPTAKVERASVSVRWSSARAGDITISLDGVLDARPFAVDDFPLRGVSHGLSMQILPCSKATVSVGGVAVPGSPQVSWDGGRPASSAVVTVHEAWSV
ncbi:hypothetical protein ACIBG8_29445 [Nonomuraea sp. NPDC050556]|uniref:hypothetical protein n=1 Tax=Nonomuraea sp. NPDC050556 TaxID=3364369 RepID=UPI00378CC5A4